MEQQQGNSSSSVPASNELEIIDAEPVSMLPPNFKPRRGKSSIGKFNIGTKIGLPPGWFYELRPRTNAKYNGKVDQFFYEPGTKRKFRSLKSVEKYLMSTGQSVKLVNPSQALQQNAQRKLEALSAAAAVPISYPSNSQATIGDKEKELPVSASSCNTVFNFKDAPEEVTWVLTNVENNAWTSFLGENKVKKGAEQCWAKTFMMMNGRKDEYP